MRSRRSLAVGISLLAAASGLLAVAVVPLLSRGSAASSSRAAVATPASSDPVARAITKYQTRLRTHPDDWQAWGNLALVYVQQARVAVDPTYYPKADAAVQRSLQLNRTDNYIALAGRAALKSARHDFSGALRDTLAASKINAYNSTIFGAMADAYTQLGRYSDAETAIDRMLQLRPGTPAFARASYAAELAGDIPAARAALNRALDDAASPADQAFVHYYLGELDLGQGHPSQALASYRRGLAADPTDSACLEGVAKAEAALGQTAAAIRDFTTVVNRVPQPQYVLELGELLQSLGRTTEAQQQYAVFETELRLFSSNGVNTDLEPAQFYADHGDPAKALRYARAGVKVRPFLEVQDALAWALHRTGDDKAALAASKQAMAEGTRNALFYYHRGMIEKSLGMTAPARSHLATALTINPAFNPLQAPVARRALAALGGTP